MRGTGLAGFYLLAKLARHFKPIGFLMLLAAIAFLTLMFYSWRNV